ncbi:MAG: hypothetical protein IPJ34_39475 [Myxococcales bacterium]|nr:hypothetical protein [Myxococcales bacterium]
MRPILLLALLAPLSTAACRGDTVGAPPADDVGSVDGAKDSASIDTSLGDGGVDTSLGDGGVDTGAGDGGVDTSLGDGPLDLGAYDAAFDGGCVPTGKNLVPSLESLSGWGITGFTPAVIEGPCGKGLHLRGTALYANVRRHFVGAWPKGSVVRVRAWFHANGVVGGTPPAVTARFGHTVDGGDVAGKEIGVDADLQPTWVWMEATSTLDADETFFDLLITSNRSDAVFDDFYVAGISVTVD